MTRCTYIYDYERERESWSPGQRAHFDAKETDEKRQRHALLLGEQ